MSFFSSSGLDTIALAAAQLESQKCQDASEKFFKERKPADSKAKSIKEESVVNDDVSSSSNPDIVITINENDVLCGRGGETNHHPGKCTANIIKRDVFNKNDWKLTSASFFCQQETYNTEG